MFELAWTYKGKILIEKAGSFVDLCHKKKLPVDSL